ncbi:hypothetical protein O181_030680 [Austropuccinia psidii MF-1]|uniref:Uncharacterized protein n=1 Tax=Austropuccinia psidii MF-1 TaxID=1389203 RepID=A0A9Q3CWM1_9BASI|nr:hypothetical protein [Austropuccinia psidii MF-1]
MSSDSTSIIPFPPGHLAEIGPGGPVAHLTISMASGPPPLIMGFLGTLRCLWLLWTPDHETLQALFGLDPMRPKGAKAPDFWTTKMNQNLSLALFDNGNLLFK